MFSANQENTLMIDKVNPAALVIEIAPDNQLAGLVANLNHATPWADRKAAAERLGNLGNPLAVQALTEVLPNDPFWMVRCAIIQALEKIGDRKAVPTLKAVAENDSFKVVRAYAAHAVQRFS